MIIVAKVCDDVNVKEIEEMIDDINHRYKHIMNSIGVQLNNKNIE